jgi:hypothetical protein
MFRQYLHRVYQNVVSGHRRRAPKLTRTSRPTVARLAVEGLEERTLLSFVSLTSQALIYAPATSVANSISISDNAGRYTITDMAEVITLTGPFILPSGNFTHSVSFAHSNIPRITVNMFNQNFTVNIEQTVQGQPVTINLGNGTDTVNISPGAHSLDRIQGSITVHSGQGIDTLNVNDQAGAGSLYQLWSNSLRRLGTATIFYGGMNFITLNGGGLGRYDVFDTESTYATTLNTGLGPTTVNVSATSFVSTLNINDGAEGVNVNLADAHVTLNSLHGTINVNGANQGVDNLFLGDQLNQVSRTFTVTTDTITWTNSVAIVHYNSLINHVSIRGGLNATFNVQGTGAPVTLAGGTGGTVNVGNNGMLQQITHDLVIMSNVTLNVDDSADRLFRHATLQTEGLSRITGITGEPTAAIYYYPFSDDSVTIQTGTGGAIVDVKATHSPVTLVGNATGTVNVGDAGSLQLIASSLTITDPPPGAFVTVNVDDSADPNPRTATVDTVTIAGLPYGRITGLTAQPSAAIQYKYADTTSVSIMTGMGGAVVNVMAIVKPITLTGSPTGGTVTLVGPNTDNTWNLNSPNAGTLSSALFDSTVTFSNVQNLTGGSGADNFVFADGAGVDGAINGGGGTNTLDYSAYFNSSVIVDLQLPTTFATGVAGGIVGATIQNVIGGNFNGDAGLYNLLIGDGSNVLTGGKGRRNLLVAGGVASTLNGGDQEDLLIAGTTNYDGDPLGAWSQIAAEWASSDDFGMRITKLSSGSGVPRLDPTTVFGNGGGNTLNGTGARAWIFSHDELDTINNFDPSSPIVKING